MPEHQTRSNCTFPLRQIVLRWECTFSPELLEVRVCVFLCNLLAFCLWFTLIAASLLWGELSSARPERRGNTGSAHKKLNKQVGVKLFAGVRWQTLSVAEPRVVSRAAFCFITECYSVLWRDSYVIASAVSESHFKAQEHISEWRKTER